jgi:hypothetical protein
VAERRDVPQQEVVVVRQDAPPAELAGAAAAD